MSHRHHSIANIHFIATPLESHEFDGAPNDFRCTVCQRPRALHQHDGFRPVDDGERQRVSDYARVNHAAFRLACR